MSPVHTFLGLYSVLILPFASEHGAFIPHRGVLQAHPTKSLTFAGLPVKLLCVICTLCGRAGHEIQ